jgi:hypothetical protein
MARLFTTARPHLASHEQIIMHGVAMDMCTRAQTLLKRERYAFFERVGTTSKRESFRDSAAAMLVAATLFGVPGEVAAGALAQAEAHVLLDVPYVSQTPELCGGAAVAMVLRYWGERDVFPQDFASLVGSDTGGILTGTLTSAVLDRGWQALVLPTAADSPHARIRSEIDRGRPLIALIEVAPHLYHYVVIVGSTDQVIVVHDPARAPFRVLTWAEFDRAWTGTGRWSMLVLPPSGFSRGDAPTVTPTVSVAAGPPASPSCDALVEHSVDLAIAGDAEAADRGLVAAVRLCPQDAAPWRELAGMRFSQSRWSEAADLALAAAHVAPDDAYTWQLVATSRHLMGDAMGALDAWNRTGEPRIDAIDVRGAVRTQQPVVVRAAGLQPRQVLTPEAYGQALRRLRALPATSNAQLRYEPIDGGRARVDVRIDERRTFPRGWLALASLGARAIVLNELVLDIPGGLGAGERETVSWRWSAERPRVALDLALPSPKGLPGIMSLEGAWERQSYQSRSLGGARLIREERQRIAADLSDWSRSWLRWRAGVALDRLGADDGQGQRRFRTHNYLAVEGSVEARLASDRLALAASGGWWAPVADGNGFQTGDLLAAWRSTADSTRRSWSALTEFRHATRVTPLALWQGAGTGQGRGGLLRAHSLLHGDVLDGEVFGRDMVRGSLESERPLGSLLTGGLSIAGFVDVARAWGRLGGLDPSRLYVDAGVGVRVRGPGGVVRLDVARGLRGGGTVFSASWGGAWPR